MSDHYALYRETARYVNRVIRRPALTADMLHRWVEEAKHIKGRRGLIGLYSHYERLFKSFLTEGEIERLKHAPRKNELSRQLIDTLVQERVLSPKQARWVKQYVK